MRLFIALIIAIALAAALVGCSGGDEPSTVTQVDNPQAEEETQQAEQEEESGATSEEPATAAEPAKSEKGFTMTKSGLQYKDISVGRGPAAKSYDRVTVHYRGWLDNGKVFDTSMQPGREPFSFTIDNDAVIAGWHEGLKGMKVGGKRELIIPPKLGYGSDDMGTIPPNSTLHFEIQLLEIGK